ncbi:hypothetical protein DL897_07795 [Thermoflavimicrobium daqui]|uniref:Prohead serine protease domain-containing protein n=1 Tax=Thermoflavimicrobium daqui TaxID=2137476 RepID=A0A364K6Y8_9BACL|nr:hypothetical protein DL897_07795 [Thermoflavimicrobium daqui]
MEDQWDQSDPENIIRTLIDVNLIEISPTPFPVYPSTYVGIRSIQEVYTEFLSKQQPSVHVNLLCKRLELAEKLSP